MDALNDILNSLESLGNFKKPLDDLLKQMPEKERKIMINFQKEMNESIKTMDMDKVNNIFNDMAKYIETLKNDNKPTDK